MDNNILNTKNELEALNNCLNYYNLTGYKIHEYFQEDKRRTKKMYFLTDEKGISLTGHWEYLELNHFIGGYGKACNEYAKLKEQNNSLLGVLKQFIHSVDHEGYISGRVVDAVYNAKEAIKNAAL